MLLHLFGRTILLTVLATLALLVISPSGQLAAAKPPVTTLYFDLYFLWGASDPDVIDIATAGHMILGLRSDGRFDTYDRFGTLIRTDVGDWATRRRGTTIFFALDNGTYYSGTLAPDGWYEGAMTGYLGNTGVWTGHFRP